MENGGRLGNQLFQIAALKALALKNNCDAYLSDDIDTVCDDGQFCLLNCFKHNTQLINREYSYSLVNNVYEQNYSLMHTGIFDKEYHNVKPYTAVEGQFESEQYFKEYKKEIKESLELRDDIDDTAAAYINEIKDMYSNKPIVAIHLRRGDVIYDLYYNTDTKYESNMLKFINYCKETYFSNTDCVFLIFSGGAQDNSNTDDINWCRQNLPEWKNIHFCEGKNDITDFAIFTKCSHAILTSNSTFGWWGSYLIKNEGKRIYVPRSSIGCWKNPDFFWSEEFIQVTMPTSD